MLPLEISSVIVAGLAIVFTFNSHTFRLGWQFYRLCRSILTPSAVRCESLLWCDVPEGRLHCHSGSGGDFGCVYCREAFSHCMTHECWNGSLALVFNNAWQSRHKKWTQKPDALPLNKKFIRCDSKVVLAYFLTTSRAHRFKSELFRTTPDHIFLRDEGNVLFAHLGKPQWVLDLTKDEVEKILDGWPPFYRKNFESIEGYLLQSPLETFDDIRRPGWIVAIGLGKVQPTAFFVQTRQGSGGLFDLAIERVSHVLQKFSEKWEDQITALQAITKTLNRIDTMRKNGPSTGGLKERISLNIVTYPESEDVKALKKIQCDTLMRVFTRMELSDTEKGIIDPALEACLERVELGVQLALKYTSTDREMSGPLLEGYREVYLEACI